MEPQLFDRFLWTRLSGPAPCYANSRVQTLPDTPELPAHLSCPSCSADQLRPCGELWLEEPYQQFLVACLECERVFVYTKFTTVPPLVRKHLMH